MTEPSVFDPISPNSRRKGKIKGKKKRKEGKENIGQESAPKQPCLITTSELRDLIDNSEACQALRLTTLTPTLPPSFFKIFQNLRVLDLRSAGLTVLSPHIIELQLLQKLDLRNNQLTYLPSQIAQLPNLRQLHVHEDRDRRTRLLKEPENLSLVARLYPDDTPLRKNAQTPPTAVECGPSISSPYDICECRRNESERLRTLPNLAQLCARVVLSSIPATKSDDSEAISWEDLEPLYKTGKLEEAIPDILASLPFPSHFLPLCIPYDICSRCSEIVLPTHAEIIRIQEVALCRVSLRYIFCSHTCVAEMLREWDVEKQQEDERRRVRQQRFEVKTTTAEA